MTRTPPKKRRSKPGGRRQTTATVRVAPATARVAGSKAARAEVTATRRAKASHVEQPFDLDVTLYETTATHGRKASEVLKELGCRVRPAASPENLTASGRTPRPDVALIGLPDGASALGRLAAMAERPVLIAALAGPLATAPARATAAGADLFVVRPHAVETLVPALHAAVRLARLAGALAEQRRAGNAELLRTGQVDPVTGFRHFDFFKEVLVRELKRARRHDYGLAATVIALDVRRPAPSDEVVRSMRGHVAAAIVAHTRDIDLPVDLATDRMLVLLPHTDQTGAERVAHRIAGAVRAVGAIASAGVEHRLTVSIGIAAQRAGQPVSFARLMRDANTALRAAQLKGGDRVVARRVGAA